MAQPKRTGRLILLIVLVLAAAAGGWYYTTRDSDKAPEYTTATIARGEVAQLVTATGTLQAVTSVDVSSQISGLISDISVDFNSQVKVGQVLAKIDPATYESKLASALAQLGNTKANLTLVRLNTERTRSLRQQNLVPQQDLDQAEALLAQAEAQVAIQNATVESARVDLARCTILSPIDGIVIDRQAEVGKTVAASLNAPLLFTIANDLSKMEISAAVAEADIGSVEEKEQVNFTVDAYPNRQFRGRISQVRNAPKVTSNVVTYETIVDVRNDDLKLKPGMTANVSIVIADRRNVLRLPNSALRVRIPENLLPPPAPKPAAATAAGAAAPAAPKVLSDDERRKAMRAIMQEAGFTPGGGPPSPDVIARAQELAKERGIELDFSRWGNRGGAAHAPNTPVTRTVYKLVGTDPKTQHPEPVTVKLGISDGITTEIIEGLNEGDTIITSFVQPSATAPAAAANPFAPTRGGPGRIGR
ncbi:MAG: efflux RND transporter periplasmic adaptor subunit [Verrucomicrobia bacterium]|nr:efflux RND transporter periplasmic adaptor subunit [Verrucomicrobiota bacterium]